MIFQTFPTISPIVGLIWARARRRLGIGHLRRLVYLRIETVQRVCDTYLNRSSSVPPIDNLKNVFSSNI